MAARGSDCVTGKHQYATKDAAKGVSKSARGRGWATYSYRCPWCACWHIGNRRNNSSKSRRR